MSILNELRAVECIQNLLHLYFFIKDRIFKHFPLEYSKDCLKQKAMICGLDKIKQASEILFYSHSACNYKISLTERPELQSKRTELRLESSLYSPPAFSLREHDLSTNKQPNFHRGH